MMHNHYFYNCNYHYHCKSIILQEQKNPNNQKCNIEIFKKVYLVVKTIILKSSKIQKITGPD